MSMNMKTAGLLLAGLVTLGACTATTSVSSSSQAEAPLLPEAKKEIYSFQTTAAVSLLSDAMSFQAAPLGRRFEGRGNQSLAATPEEVTIDDVNRYLGIMSQLLSDDQAPITTQQLESDRAEYAYKLIITTRDFAGYTSTYTLYFNDVSGTGDNSSSETGSSEVTTSEVTSTEVTSTDVISSSESLPTFTAAELALYDGQTESTGFKAYIAYDGLVYDVTNHPQWSNGTHNGMTAGQDLTALWPTWHIAPSVALANAPVVGIFAATTPAIALPLPSRNERDEDEDEEDEEEGWHNDDHEDEGEENDEQEIEDEMEDLEDEDVVPPPAQEFDEEYEHHHDHELGDVNEDGEQISVEGLVVINEVEYALVGTQSLDGTRSAFFISLDEANWIRFAKEAEDNEVVFKIGMRTGELRSRLMFKSELEDDGLKVSVFARNSDGLKVAYAFRKTVDEQGQEVIMIRVKEEGQNPLLIKVMVTYDELQNPVYTFEVLGSGNRYDRDSDRDYHDRNEDDHDDDDQDENEQDDD